MAQNYNWCHIFARAASELISASMIAAALGDVSRDLKVVGYTAQIIFSTYFLGLATGLFVAAAFSEVTSRKDTWLFCNAWWDSLCPLGNSKALMIAVRLVTETGASSGIAVHINTKRPISTSSSTDCCHSSKLTGPIMADMYGK